MAHIQAETRRHVRCRMPRPPRQQGGIALFIALVMLLVMTVAGVSAINTTSLEQRMATNARDSNLAFHAAEVGLRDGEEHAETLQFFEDFTAGGTDGQWSSNVFEEEPVWEIDGVWDDTRSRAGTTTIQGVAAQPRFLVEFVTEVVSSENEFEAGLAYGTEGASAVQIIRVTAQGTGGTANAEAYVQSTYGVFLSTRSGDDEGEE